MAACRSPLETEPDILVFYYFFQRLKRSPIYYVSVSTILQAKFVSEKTGRVVSAGASANEGKGTQRRMTMTGKIKTQQAGTKYGVRYTVSRRREEDVILMAVNMGLENESEQLKEKGEVRAS
jgi:hypothetical protein